MLGSILSSLWSVMQPKSTHFEGADAVMKSSSVLLEGVTSSAPYPMRLVGAPSEIADGRQPPQLAMASSDLSGAEMS
jgi:hypothetical protein